MTRVVQLDGLVLLQIISHCSVRAPEAVAGTLLGLQLDDTLEVTHSFALPQELGGPGEGEKYEFEMMRALRDVKVDNNSVGWYQCSYLGSFCTKDTIAHQVDFQTAIPGSVLIVYDGLRTGLGQLAVKAVRLTDSFLSALKKGKIGIDAVSSLSASQIFEELPLRIRNSALVSAALFDLTSRRALGAAAAPAAGAVGASAALAPAPSADVDFARLDLNSGPFLEKHLELLKDVTEQLLRAQQESSYYQRRLDANARARAEWLARRREENELRRRNKEPLLPEEDPSLPFFRAVDPPRGAKDPLDVALMSANISHYCAQVGKFSGASFGKLFLASSLHKQ